MAEEEIKKTEEQVIATSEVKTPEVKEEIKESLSETKVEEVKVEAKTEEVKVETETTKIEEKKEESIIEVKAETAKESLKEEIKKTEEELGVIKEVRDELIVVYSKNKELETQKEQLSAKIVEIEAENVKIKEQLNKYIEIEKEMAVRKKAEKLSALSEKFKLLGQEKSVEQLSSKDDATIDEFEKIVDAALLNSKKEAPSVTVNSQSTVVEKKEQLSSEKKVVLQVKKEQTKEDFFKGICAKLTKEQLGSNNNHRAIYL